MKNSSRNKNLLRQSIRLGMQNIWRNKLLSVATVFVITTILFIINIIFAINSITQSAINNLNEKIDVVVYFKESTNSEEISNIQKQVEQLTEVKKTTFISKEQALTTLQQNSPKLAESFAKYNLENPLPSSLRITTTSPIHHKTVVDFLNQDSLLAYLSQINSNQSQDNQLLSGVSNKLIEITTYTEHTILWVITIFLFGGGLIIANALNITIHTRKQDIEIMQLVGAKIWFIRAPFLLEAIFYATSSTIFATILFVLIYPQLIPSLFLQELLLTNLLAIISAQIATHRHLK